MNGSGANARVIACSPNSSIPFHCLPPAASGEALQPSVAGANGCRLQCVLGQPVYRAEGIAAPRCSRERRASARKAREAAKTWGRTCTRRRLPLADTRCGGAWDDALSWGLRRSGRGEQGAPCFPHPNGAGALSTGTTLPLLPSTRLSQCCCSSTADCPHHRLACRGWSTRAPPSRRTGTRALRAPAARRRRPATCA